MASQWETDLQNILLKSGKKSLVLPTQSLLWHEYQVRADSYKICDLQLAPGMSSYLSWSRITWNANCRGASFSCSFFQELVDMPGVMDVQLIIAGATTKDIAKFPAKTSRQGIQLTLLKIYIGLLRLYYLLLMRRIASKSQTSKATYIIFFRADSTQFFPWIKVLSWISREKLSVRPCRIQAQSVCSNTLLWSKLNLSIVIHCCNPNKAVLKKAWTNHKSMSLCIVPCSK